MYDCIPHLAHFVHKFTGKERDMESGLDNFGARYDASTMGRFMTPDPLLNSGHPSNPQTWKLGNSWTEGTFTSCSGLGNEGKARLAEIRGRFLGTSPLLWDE